MPTAHVTGAPEWVPHVALALKTEGFDILSAGEEAPLAPGLVDCYVQVEASCPPSKPGTLARTHGHPRPWRSYLDEEPDLGFADWRDEVLCLTSTTT